MFKKVVNCTFKTKVMKLTIILITLFLSSLVHSQAGNLDYTFGNYGKNRTTIPGSELSYARSVNFQSDGKIVVTGGNNSNSLERLTIVRYHINGLIDSSFAVNGILKTALGIASGTGTCTSSLVLNDDKILVASSIIGSPSSEPVLVRFSPNGELDSSFGQYGIAHLNSGILFENIYNIKIQADGKIIVLGSSPQLGYDKVLITRFNPNGDLDSNFAENGRFIYSEESGSSGYGSSIDLSAEEKIIFTYQYTLENTINKTSIVKLNGDGSLDTSFGINGRVLLEFPQFYWFRRTNIELTADDKIVLVHGTNVLNYIYRFNSDGSLDLSFGTNGNGIATSNFKYSEHFILQNDGKIILLEFGGNSSDDFILTRFMSDGSLDESFGNLGNVQIDFDNSEDLAYRLNIQDDRKIVAVGVSNDAFAILRLLNDRINTVKVLQDNLVNVSYEFVTDGILLNVEFTNDSYQFSKLKIFDLLGKEVLKTNLSEKNKILLNEKPGIYFYSIENQDNEIIFSGKILVQ